MQIAAHCFALTGFAYIPPWSVNAGIIAGNEKTLVIDSGPTRLAAETILGYAFAVRPTNTVVVVNTERHLDHIGGNSFFIEHGFEVYGHAGIQRSDEELKSDVDEFNRSISNSVRRERQEGTHLFANTRIANPTKILSSEMEFDLGGVTIRILLTPGHTPTNLCVYLGTEQVLYCGDTATSGYIPNLEGGTASSWQQWLLSLDRIAALPPRVLVCGHGPVLRGGEVKSEIQRVRAILERALQEGRAPT